MNRVLLVMIACLSFSMSSAQSSINDYKYIIVEDQFNFQNEPGQYNLNGLVHFLLRKHGFTSIIEGQALPEDLKSNFCLALRADVIAKGALRTKATIVFKDCESNEIYRTAEGITKEKDFARAYDLAIRKASDSFEGLNYAYTPNQSIIEKGRPEEVTKVVEEAKKEIVKLQRELEIVKANNEIEDLKRKNSELESLKNDSVNRKENEELIENNNKRIDSIVDVHVEKLEKEEKIIDEKEPEMIIQNGIHQETTPNVIITQSHLDAEYYVKKNSEGNRTKYDAHRKSYDNEENKYRFLFSMYETILNDVYLFKYKEKSGTIIKRENGNWVMEYLENGVYKVERIKVFFQ